MTTTILIIVNVFSALAIIVLALMQQSKGDMGAAFGGGSSQSMFGARGSANFLSRTTAIMCLVFFVSSLSLAYIYTKRAETGSVVEGGSVLESTEVPTIENEIPTIDEADVDGESVPDSSVPSIDGASDAVPSVPQSAEGAVDAAEAEIPAVPEQ